MAFLLPVAVPLLEEALIAGLGLAAVGAAVTAAPLVVEGTSAVVGGMGKLLQHTTTKDKEAVATTKEARKMEEERKKKEEREKEEERKRKEEKEKEEERKKKEEREERKKKKEREIEELMSQLLRRRRPRGGHGSSFKDGPRGPGDGPRSPSYGSGSGSGRGSSNFDSDKERKNNEEREKEEERKKNEEREKEKARKKELKEKKREERRRMRDAIAGRGTTGAISNKAEKLILDLLRSSSSSDSDKKK